MATFHIVIDTNVVVAALRSRHGASNALLQRLNDPRLTLHVSNTLLFEYDEILHREQAPLGLSEQQIADLLDGFCQLAVKLMYRFSGVRRCAIQTMTSSWTSRWPHGQRIW